MKQFHPQQQQKVQGSGQNKKLEPENHGSSLIALLHSSSKLISEHA